MPTAIFSLSDKSGLIEFAQELNQLGWKFLASGGTAHLLRDSGLPVTGVATYTQSPEILDGRVKTLHPAIAGGILARDLPKDYADLELIEAQLIDLVVCNLYPFEETIANPETPFETAVENIDIGGVTLIRAAAKNFKRVTVLTDMVDGPAILAELKSDGQTSLELRRKLAEKAFTHTRDYDTAIAGFLTGDESSSLHIYSQQTLRYGENWHQEAALFGYTQHSGPMGGKLLQGKPISYNNMLDLDAAWRAVVSYERPTVVIVKHLSPCGIASADMLAEAYPLAFESDPVSPFGGIIAVNRSCDAALITAIGDLFVECLVAPGFTPEALELLAKKKNLRVLDMPDKAIEPRYEYRSVVRGMLRQSLDVGDPEDTEWQVVTERRPTPAELRDLKFAWLACQHVKSNAIVFAKNEATIGIGGGQPNRIDCVGIATNRAGEKSKGAVLASDAFFPFADVVAAADKLGITAIIQPGGAKRDQLSIEACNQHGMAMVFTGVRHFRH